MKNRVSSLFVATLVAALFVIIGSASAQDRSVTIPDQTEVRIAIINELSSATAKVNDIVEFRVVEDVVLNGTKVIAKGAIARGTVIKAQKKGSFGRAGQLEFSINSVRSVGGESIPVRTAREVHGKGREGLNEAITQIVNPGLGFLVSGQNVKIECDTEFLVYTFRERTITVRAPGS